MATSFTGAYFSDSVSISGNTFETGSWEAPAPTSARVVINEVYYDVAPDKGLDSGDEWIELYNAGGTDISLKDWTISDNTTTVTIHADKTIVAGGFALVSKDHSPWSLYWSVPSGVEIIELGSLIGGGLANGGDRVILKDNLGNIIDQMSWSTNRTVFDPPCPDVLEGHSLSRNPLGFDTDTAADFIDLASPTPGS